MEPEGTLRRIPIEGELDVSTEPESSGSGTRAVDRAADLVATVVHANEPLTFAEVQEASGLAKSTTSRMLAALERSGLLERDEQGSYVAGRIFWLYAARHDPWEQLVRVARPTMETIGEAVGETVHLSITRDDRVVQVAQVDSTYLLGTRDWTEIDVPAHCSALGKVFLAWDRLTVPESELEAQTEVTLTSTAALRRDARLTRERGWASTVDELEVGLSGVAAPIRGARGDVIAALGISGPSQRLEEQLDELGELLIEHATDLSGLFRPRSERTGPSRSGTEKSGPAA